MRKLRKFVMLCVLGFLLCGCSVATEEEIQRYVEENY